MSGAIALPENRPASAASMAATGTPQSWCEVTLDGRSHRFFGCDQIGPDHVVLMMRQTKKWYSIDALRRLRSLGLRGEWVDVGANIGTFTVYFANQCGAEHVYAIECNPGVFAALSVNVALNTDRSRVTLINAAAFSHPCRLGLSFRYADNNATCCVTSDTSAGSVEAVILDDVLRDARRIVMLKLDVEEFEVDALMGGRRAIRDHQPMIYMECIDELKPRMEAFMREIRYTLAEPMGRNYLWAPEGWVRPATFT